MGDSLRDLKETKIETQPSAGSLYSGPKLNPQKIISTYSADEYEEFTEEWAFDVLQHKYSKVRRVGGAGDYGRDIVCYLKNQKSWVNYQCKHYNRPLSPSDALTEIGKIIYHAHSGKITLPDEYYFVAPRGVGAKLGRLMENPVKLRKELIDKWDKYCLKKITKKSNADLTPELKTFIEKIDFAIFKDLSQLEVIEGFRLSKRFAFRFGGGLPDRPKHTVPEIEKEEIQLFIKCLLDAYSEHSGRQINSLEEVAKDGEYLSHLKEQRECFYSAEFLKEFSRDSLPAEVAAFTEFQDEVFHGIIDELRLSSSDGYKNVLQATATASKLPIISSVIRDYIKVIDKKGACHQLANEGRVKWVRENG